MATATAIATELIIDQFEDSLAQTESNPLAAIWLTLAATCLGGTLLCTSVLVAWPLIAGLLGSA